MSEGFTPTRFLELLERERKLLAHVLLLMKLRDNPESQWSANSREAVVMFLSVRANQLRN